MIIDLTQISERAWCARPKDHSLWSVRGMGSSPEAAIGQLLFLFPTSCGVVIEETRLGEADLVLAASAADWQVP